MPGPSTSAPPSTETVEPDLAVDPDRPWITIVWNDPINLMSYVTDAASKRV